MRTTGIIALALAGSSFGALASTAQAQSLDPQAPAQAENDATPEGDIVVLGSRIPRIQREGPAPVTTITSDEILRLLDDSDENQFGT